MAEYEVVVVGGGCIGCSIAKHLAEKWNLDVAVIEKEYHLAEHQSGRNSGVLHPGFNYEPGSTKARFATEGTDRMKSYAAERDIPLEEFGVVVVATNSDEEQRLSDIQSQADQNGVETEIIDKATLQEYEPHASGQAALYCPEAASVDSQQYVYELASDAKAAGVEFYMGHTAQGGETTTSEVTLSTDKGAVTGDFLINTAGLYADKLAAEFDIGTDYRIIPFRGDYYEIVPERRHLCNTMIYPTPDPELPFLGVHYTRRTDGKVIVGPNAVLAFAREAYKNTDFDITELFNIFSFKGFWKLMTSKKMINVAVDELNKSYRKEKFVQASQKLVPEAEEQDFVKSYAGVRAQLVTDDGELVKDPMTVSGPRSLHVLNAVSPGLTCSLPYGEHVAEQAVEDI